MNKPRIKFRTDGLYDYLWINPLQPIGFDGIDRAFVESLIKAHVDAARKPKARLMTRAEYDEMFPSRLPWWKFW